MGELLKKLVLENTVPYNTPLPLLYYRKKHGWFRRRKKYYNAFIVLNDERRLLVEDTEIIIGSPLQVGPRSVKVIVKIWLDYLGGLQEDDGLMGSLTINLVKLGYLLDEICEGNRFGNYIDGDTRWVCKADFENSEFYKQLTNTMMHYLHLEISPYEKYNPKWWKKESRKPSLNIGTSELVQNLRKSGVLEKRGLEEDALETLLYLNPDPTLLRLIIDFALGEAGRNEFELWLSKNSNENKSISVVPKE